MWQGDLRLLVQSGEPQQGLMALLLTSHHSYRQAKTVILVCFVNIASLHKVWQRCGACFGRPRGWNAGMTVTIAIQGSA
jgi:hypothetical protein